MAVIDYAWALSDEKGRIFDHQIADLTVMCCETIFGDRSSGLGADSAPGRKGDRTQVMVPERLRHAQWLMADKSLGSPSIFHELGSLPISRLYHYLRADASLKEPGRTLLGSAEVSVGKLCISSPPQPVPDQALER